ncbi:HlyD family efflux transporter periplasmic adaptor subunit [Prolixibacteraceae bacterium JC049]|nr:HlyD family efflux transporter periplasmic adaptor subunit [Prolixibacteraceae bacterium JC049]
MKFKRIHLLVLVILSFVQCKNKESQPAMKEANVTEFNIQVIKNGQVFSKVSITGRVVPEKKVNIVSEVQGVITNESGKLEDGIRYQKGDLILAIDDDDAGYALKAQKSDFIATLIKSMSDIKLDYPNEFKTWNLFLESISEQQPLPELPELKNNQLRFFLTGRNILKVYYSIKSQEEKLSKYKLYAPFDGVVTKSAVDVGDLVSPGLKLGEFISTKEYEIVTAVNSVDVHAIKIGQPIELNAPNFGQKISTTVDRISENLNEKTQSVNVYLKSNDPLLRAGMYLEGELIINSWENAVRIPKQQLTRDSKVFLIKSNAVQAKSVNVLTYEENTVIVQGLSSGDVLIMEQVRPTQIGNKAKAK